MVPWKIEQAGQDYRIYVYDNNLPGDESIYYIAHSEGGYSCNYQYGHNPITVNRLGMQYLQWVLDGERSVSKGNAIYNKYMFVSVNSPDAEITTSSGISTDQIDGAIRIEHIPLDGTITSYTDYWLPFGEYEISSRSSRDVSILVSDENETYTLTIIPENKNATVKIGTRIMPGSIAHGNIMTYSEDGGTQLLPAVLNEDGELLLPGTNFIPASYSDMHDTTAWYHEPIISVSAVGLVNGIGTNYEPNSTLTVGMLITILMRIEHGILPLGETWYDTNINAAIQDGILQTTDGLEPMQQVTRGQAALLLSRFIEHFNSGWAKNRVEDSPSDISTVPAQYRDSVEKVYHWNLIHGDEQGRFNSESYLTRAEIAQIIYNYYSIVD